MNSFHRHGDALRCEECPLADLAEIYGTPLYVYSMAALEENFNAYRDAFSPADPLICYSVKSNGNLAVLRAMAGLGAGADIVSGGELFRALTAGIDPGRIVYSGAGKRADELRMALDAGIRMFNVESEPELLLLSRIAASAGKTADISLRINPDIDSGTHRYTATGGKETKFGVPEADAPALYRKAASLPGINPTGIDVHLGSQITDIAPYRLAMERLVALAETLRASGIDCRVLDIGGGAGISYNGEKTVTPADLAGVAIPAAESAGCALVLEPGRSIAGNAGILLTRITHVKRGAGKTFYICDAGMNDLMRPPLYGSYHRIEPVADDGGGAVITADIVGPVCETADFLALGRAIPECREGELLAVMDAGAYGFSMSSNYNARPRAAEVMVSGRKHRFVRSRETYDDLVRNEMIFA